MFVSSQNISLMPGTLVINRSGQIQKINYKGLPCKNCKCAGCKHKNICGKGLGDAQADAEALAKNRAYAAFAQRTITLTNNGTQKDEYTLTRFVKDLAISYGLVFINPFVGITSAEIATARYLFPKTDQEVSTIIRNNPEIKQTISNIVDKIVKLPGAVIDTVTKTVKTAGDIMQYLPWIIGGVVVLIAAFIFLNPGVIKR